MSQGFLLSSGEPYGPHRMFERLIVTYDGQGENIKKHSIDAVLFANSIMGLSDNIKYISEEVCGVDVEVQIRAQKEGSIEAIIDFFNTKEVIGCACAATLLQFFGLDVKSLSKAIVKILSWVISKIIMNSGDKEKLINDIEDIEIFSENDKRQMIRLIKNKIFLHGLDGLTAPLDDKEIDDIKIKHDEEIVIEITSQDREYFVYKRDEEREESVDEKKVKVIYLSPEKDKWQFRSGTLEFWADVEDDRFLEEMKDISANEIQEMNFVATVKELRYRKLGANRSKVERSIIRIQQAPIPPLVEMTKAGREY